MKFVNQNDKNDIRNWCYITTRERIKVSLLVLFGGFMIMMLLLQSNLPKGSSFFAITLGFTMLLTPSILIIISYHITVNKHNKEVIKFKRMTKEEQDEYIQRRDSNFKK